MNKKIKVIYKKLTPKLKKYGYINLNHRPVNTKDDLVEIANIFRSPEYETFRMIYIKNNKIAGYESISSKIPSFVPIFRDKKTNINNCEKGFYKMQERMKRLNADSYYMVHNHPSGTAKASATDIETTRDFIQNLKGFKGHLIIGSDKYSWIEQDKTIKKQLLIYNHQPINFKKADKFSKILKKKTIFDAQIKNRDDLVNLMYNIINTKDYSTAILTDTRNKVRMILDIPNTMINQELEQLNGYFKNLARQNGVSNVFFATDDNETFTKSLCHLVYGTFKDSICYKELNNKQIAICEGSPRSSNKRII